MRLDFSEVQAVWGVVGGCGTSRDVPTLMVIRQSFDSLAIPRKVSVYNMAADRTYAYLHQYNTKVGLSLMCIHINSTLEYTRPVPRKTCKMSGAGFD